MLSAREFATSMLVCDSADHIAERKELDALLERQLVAMEKLAVPSHVTHDDDVLLCTHTRIH
ncbi:hypothetical protein J8I87_31315 [Paraburkholderia sp. LEh10]|jgi:hypothetical protein|uniref:hypothetical protein n=1 Tax=Paraburkholderia sp. LEh10 TaxID=2821353 RepID=UPI001AE9B142|nr:hypothetical protein [Paraburkholderia sp. LEh10]MBP0594083.1 hypothetical protein [Paraburkholderia sp. LEh10]